MKKILFLLALTAFTSVAFAEAEVKTVCHDKVGKDGKTVMGKDGTAVQECKKIKVHKKLEGDTPVPTKK
jgi:hypothetical protein